MPRTTMEVSRRIIHALELFEKQTLRAREVVNVGDIAYAAYLDRKETRHLQIGRNAHTLFAFNELCDILLDEGE